jgi:Tfp pilus assembly protein PilF
MNKIQKNVRNIYRAPEEREVDYGPPSGQHPEIEEDIRRHRLMSIVSGVIAVTIVVVITLLIAQQIRDEARIPPPPPAAPVGQEEYVPYNSLPMDELWVMNYSLVADQARLDDDSDFSFSTKWIKNAAYNVILGQQALAFGNPGKAVYHFEQALDVLPELKDVHEPLGFAYLKWNKPLKAAEHLKLALQEKDDFMIRSDLGVALMQSGNLDQAEESLQIALQQNPDHPGVYKNLALLYREREEPEKAFRFFSDYFSQNDDDLSAAAIFANYLVEQDRHQQAVAFLEQYSEQISEQALPLHLLLAKIHSKQTNTTAAVAALEKITRYISPNLALTELNQEAFDPIRSEEEFEKLVHQFEMAAIALKETP